ncbi:MAG TPA: hypothetical protein VKM55_22480 [Candidatus Lokiarchaeia archaeon]|nr:hypothetical protein [Candidatus Lokiarchaeia archaeon]
MMDDPGHKELLRLRGVLDEWFKTTSDPIRNGPCPIPPNAVVDNAREFPHLVGHHRVKKTLSLAFYSKR